MDIYVSKKTSESIPGILEGWIFQWFFNIKDSANHDNHVACLGASHTDPQLTYEHMNL